MGIQRLDHYSVRTTDLQRAIRFYEDALGFHSGPRPSFRFPGAWMYTAPHADGRAGSAIVHLIGTGSVDGGLTDYLGDKPAAAPAHTGALDHIAFAATGIADLYARLALRGIPFRQRQVPDLGLHQVFINDPDGVTIELNYASADDIAAGLAHCTEAAGSTP